MACPEEEESQVLIQGFKIPTDIPSSLLSLRDASGAARHDVGNESCRHIDDLVTDQNIFNPETQYDSLANHIDETQFVMLEPETQAFDLNPLTPNSRRVLEPVSVGTITTIEAFTNMPFISTFERPKDLDIGEDELRSGFKFDKAPKPVAGQFSRSHGITVNINPTPKSAAIPKETPATETLSTGMFVVPKFNSADIFATDEPASLPPKPMFKYPIQIAEASAASEPPAEIRHPMNFQPGQKAPH